MTLKLYCCETLKIKSIAPNKNKCEFSETTILIIIRWIFCGKIFFMASTLIKYEFQGQYSDTQISRDNIEM